MINISKLSENIKNPRKISKDDLEALVSSISEMPEMMALRPIVYDEGGVVLGGNQRFKALKKIIKNPPASWI
jgi:ParB-like chromosome segregation protein Spo0J